MEGESRGEWSVHGRSDMAVELFYVFDCLFWFSFFSWLICGRERRKGEASKGYLYVLLILFAGCTREQKNKWKRRKS